jgi:hemolysin III
MEDQSRLRNEPPKRSLLEEIGNAVTHGVGALFAIAGFVLLLLKSDSPVKLLCAIVYGLCLLMMFLMSCLYHSFKWGTKVKRLWRRFDYISIYLLIGGTFTPLWLLFWGGRSGTVCCIVQWVLILTGIVFVAVFGPGRPRVLHPVLFVVLGWCGLVFLPRLVRENFPLFLATLIGGIIYTVGVIPFALKKKGAHFLWHFFVFFAAIVHWFGIYLYLF